MRLVGVPGTRGYVCSRASSSKQVVEDCADILATLADPQMDDSTVGELLIKFLAATACGTTVPPTVLCAALPFASRHHAHHCPTNLCCQHCMLSQ